MAVGKVVVRKTPHKRLGLRARHIIRSIRGAQHTSVQRAGLNELAAEIDRPHGSRKRTPAIPVGDTGFWTPLSARAKHALARLRTARNHRMQQQLVSEVRHEIVRAEARELRRIKARQWAERQLERAKNGGRATGRWFRRRGQQVRRLGRRVRGSSVWRRPARTPAARTPAARTPATRTPAARTPAAPKRASRAGTGTGRTTRSTASGGARSTTSRASASASRASRS